VIRELRSNAIVLWHIVFAHFGTITLISNHGKDPSGAMMGF